MPAGTRSSGHDQRGGGGPDNGQRQHGACRSQFATSTSAPPAPCTQARMASHKSTSAKKSRWKPELPPAQEQKKLRALGERHESAPGMVLLLSLLFVEALVPGVCETPCPDFPPPYLVARAEDWNASQSHFADASGNGRHGVLTAGNVSTGTVGGNGAQISVPFVGGSDSTVIQWPTSSVPTTFTICSITRYTGSGPHDRILVCPPNWLHGHWNSQIGATYYEGAGDV